MDARSILGECDRRGVALYIGEASDGLAYDAPAGALAPELREALREHKAELIALLYDLEERAAIEGCPEWMDARAWRRMTDSPAVRFLLARGCEKDG